MADWLFDGPSKIIKEPAGTGDTTFDVRRDIYSAWKRWVINSGAQFEKAFSVEGGTPIGDTGLFTGTTFILTNGWKLMPADHDHQATLIGNLYSDDGVVSTNNPIGNGSIFVSASVAAQGVSTASVQQVTLDAINTIVQEIRQIQGGDGANPLVVTDDSITTGSIDIQITGDETVKILTRQ